MRYAGFFLMSFLLTSAAWPMQASCSVRITDNRSEDAKKGHRDSNFSAIAFLPDRAIKPGPLEQLATSLNTRYPTAEGELAIQELSIVDVFFNRIRSGPGEGALMSFLVDRKTDWAFLQENDVPKDQDSILCVLRASYGGRQVTASAVVPYKLGPSAMMVRSSAQFREAVAACIDRLAGKVVLEAS